MRIVKKLFYGFAIVSFVFASTALAQGGILTQSDKREISQELNVLIRSINAGNVQGVVNLISPNNHTLRQKIEKQLTGRIISYQLEIPPDKNIEVLGVNKVRIKAKFAASGVGWHISGLSTYFVFEKYGGHWFISDTDFYQKLGKDYVFKILKKVFVFAGPVFISILIFWAWMLIDAIKRDFDNKAIWIISLMLFGIIGAVAYYFIIKRRALF